MEERLLETLYRAVDYFGRVTREDFPAQQLLIFLHICIHERKTIHELHQELGMPQGSVSRNVKKLSVYRDRETGEKGGYGLLHTERDLDYPNRVAVKLTTLGREVKENLMRILEEGSFA